MLELVVDNSYNERPNETHTHVALEERLVTFPDGPKILQGKYVAGYPEQVSFGQKKSMSVMCVGTCLDL